jgi:hypothetical protein
VKHTARAQATFDSIAISDHVSVIDTLDWSSKSYTVCLFFSPLFINSEGEVKEMSVHGLMIVASADKVLDETILERISQYVNFARQQGMSLN